jgi:hypothetical protein
MEAIDFPYGYVYIDVLRTFVRPAFPCPGRPPMCALSGLPSTMPAADGSIENDYTCSILFMAIAWPSHCSRSA